MAAAEAGDGWLSACEATGRFLAPCRELVDALAEHLRSLAAGPVLEVCAGGGGLAAALRRSGVAVEATDADPPPGAPVQRATALEALRRYRRKVVLGSFVPVDAGVDEAVLGFPSVRHYVVLGSRLGGELGSAALWNSAGWSAWPLKQVARWMLTRHDVWIGPSHGQILRHGEAWHFARGG